MKSNKKEVVIVKPQDFKSPKALDKALEELVLKGYKSFKARGGEIICR